jgi:hypothetical protein
MPEPPGRPPETLSTPEKPAEWLIPKGLAEYELLQGLEKDSLLPNR